MLRTLGARRMRQPLLRGATAAHTNIHIGVRAQLRRLQTVASSDAHEALKDEDISLRDIFDLPTKTTMGSRWFHTAGQPTGLLMESRFVSPKTFRSAGEQAVAEAEALLQKVLTAQSFSEKRNVVKCLDQLSDALCRVMDVAELVRQAHPDSHWQEAADEVYAFMFEYMNGLNTHVGLYRKLVEIMGDAQISATFSAVEHEVALSFRRDFERSGIHLTKSDHERFVALSSDIQELSREFFRRQSVPRESSTVKMPFDQLRTLPSQVAMGILQSSRTSKGKDGTTVIEMPVDDYTAHYVLRDCSEEKVREAVYRQWQHGDEQAVGALEALLERRLALSHTVGFESFAHMTLDDKMARSPSHVVEFLKALAKQGQPRWSAIADSLHAAKAAHTKADPATLVYPWDREYYVGKQMMDRGALPSLSQYFSLGRVVMGLSRVFKSLYGVELRAAMPRPGEIWHPEVRKLEVVDENSQLLGIIYCDVFSRSSKAHVGAAHFTARCARRIDDDVAVDGLAPEYSSQSVVERNGQKFQLPVVVLICDFPVPSEGSPPLLSWSNVETIFHEMGHAMHSMLGQNGFHNVAGTRCPVDFVELPSILMEHFARSPQALSLFASHYKTGAPLPPELVRQHAEQRRRYTALDLHAQLFMSALDQKYHASTLDSTGNSLEPGWSTFALAQLHDDPMLSSGKNSSLFGYVRDTRWQSRFTHLIGYGASYYAYLFDRVLAGQIWDRVFCGDYPYATAQASEESNPLSREAGERFKNEVLSWGGGRNPWKSLASVLDNGKMSAKDIEVVARGDKHAMGIVGSWRLPDL